MPNREPVVAQQDRVSIRHIGVRALIWPDAPNAVTNYSLLSQITMVARPLPSSPLPTSPDFASGSWTGRLGDAGEGSLTFPNATASDGIPWRDRFDPTGHLQFVEIYFNDELDFAGVIDKVAPGQQQVAIHAYDGWWLLKKAYERDWTVIRAPRDVIERGTQVWLPTTVDGFPAGSLASQWTASGTGSAAIGDNGGLVLTAPAADYVDVVSTTVTVDSTSVWRSSCTVLTDGLSTNGFVSLQVSESSGDGYSVQYHGGYAGLVLNNSTQYAQIQLPASPTVSLMVESDGRWIAAYANGLLIGMMSRQHSSTTSLETILALDARSASSQSTATIGTVLTEAQQPFLMRGSDRGDYVLPGDASTYPVGGLHARYFNDLDLQADSARPAKLLAPGRRQAYGGSGTQEYANQQDSEIANQANPTPGAASSNWSCIWFGAIWLPLSKGDMPMSIEGPTSGGVNCATRVWIGKTQFGEQLADNWPSALPFPNTWDLSFTVSASTLAGTLPYGGGTMARDGWYPIIVEYAVDGVSGTAPTLYFGASGGTLPYSWTDPGGGAFTSGAGALAVPGTSLSPLGCVDQRYQGISHFDLVQQTAQAYGYQASVEPQQLESGLFPGVLAPRIREGHDTDIILRPDRSSRQDGEGVLNYSSTLDASDFASSIQGNGAGFQSGTTGQLQANVYDAATIGASLFDAQAWQDFSDASFASLLQALLNSQLALQLDPWQLLSADPTGRPRKAFTWPLPGTIENMRWRPGDGLRIQAPDINVMDTSPRQMLVVTRNLAPYGITATQATFANRPKNQAHTLKRELYSATRLQRNYQRQLTSISGTYVDGASLGTGAASGYSMIALSPADLLVRAQVRIAYNSGNQALNLLVNGTDVTLSPLNGPWTTAPVLIDISAVAKPTSDNRLYVAIKNAGSAGTSVSFQLLATVLH